tara:strand:- start:201 stop:416 length:216 start_codon:yes stop_codon:yes gene_type:complete
MNSYKEIIEQWPSAQEFGTDVGVTGSLARVWKSRNTLPPRHWNLVVEKGQARGIDISLDLLAELAERREAA